MKHFSILCILWILLLSSLEVNAIPKNQRGNRKYRKEGIHNGNLVETIFYNFGEVAWWGRQPTGVWPRGSNHPYMDGITPLVLAEATNKQGLTFPICEAGYRELMDISPEGIERGWQPRPGYANALQDKIAMSDNPSSWPSSWADKDAGWNGYWNGYFGKRTNADQESYFVVDDDADDGHDYWPDSTDLTRRGLGLKMGVRGFQWSNTMAEDLIFWHYDITNEGTYVYQKMIFGMYVDVGVGGQYDSNDDNASFELADDITYSWDSNNLGEGGWGPTGWCGYAFLESPGNPFNHIDDDGDGEIGSPTVTSTMILGEISDNGIDDNQNGLIDEAEMHIGFKYADGIDNDGNGVIDEMIDERRDDLIDNDLDWDKERDDVGADGVPGTGDSGEGDGLPTTGEANFDATDKDESDQIGLTAFDVFYIGSGVSFQKDAEIFSRVSFSHFDTQLQNGNIAFLYGSGLFPLKPLLTERFSVCLIFGENLEDIKRNKQIVQDVYNNNYNFARPPDKPKVKAIAGDGYVTLYWDDQAENSYDFFSKPPNDFEGYKIYRSTDPGFLDTRIITNAFGEKTFLQPSAQFDLRDEVEGFFPLDYQGIKVYMGDNKGLQHSWTDRSVMNGKTYYYAIVSYDKGDASRNMYPSECSRVVVRDVNGNVRLDDNTVEITPSAPASGYNAAGLTDSIRQTSGVGTGIIWVDILDPLSVKDNQTYRLVFDDTTHQDSISYSFYTITQPAQPITVFSESFFCHGEDFNPLFDGIRLMVYNDTVAWDGARSGWSQGNANLSISVENRYSFPIRRSGYPSSYEIRFGESDTSWWFVPRFQVNFQIWDTYENKKVLFALEEPNAAQRDSSVSPGDYIRIILKDGTTPREIWRVNFLNPLSGETAVVPQDGDRLQIKIKTPFRSGDTYEFTTRAARIDELKATQGMDSIVVVPNPYIVAARWEPPRLYSTGRGERRLFFIHLPQDCSIRIYTVSGDLVQTLEHHSSMMDGSESWDLKTKDGLDSAPGIYLFHVDAGLRGEKIGRFAIIK